MSITLQWGQFGFIFIKNFPKSVLAHMMECHTGRLIDWTVRKLTDNNLRSNLKLEIPGGQMGRLRVFSFGLPECQKCRAHFMKYNLELLLTNHDF